jgi:hypothetical protein
MDFCARGAGFFLSLAAGSGYGMRIKAPGAAGDGFKIWE